MDQSQLAVFKYKHDDRTALSVRRKIFFAVSLVVSLVLSFVLFPGGALTLFVPLVAWFGSVKKIYVGPRYLVCGNQIVYYANVTKLTLDEAAGVLSLQSANGKLFRIERERFPTNARKKDKIAINKAAKFSKVTARIVEKVRRATPEAANA